MRRHPEHKIPETPDSLVAKAQALKHLMSLGLPPQSGMYPDNMSVENTKALMVKRPNKKAQGMIIHQIYKTPGM